MFIKVKIILYIYIHTHTHTEKIVMLSSMPSSPLPLIHSSTYCISSWLLFLFFIITQKHKTIHAVVVFFSLSLFYLILIYPKSHSISVHSLFNHNLFNQFSIRASKVFIFSLLCNNK